LFDEFTCTSYKNRYVIVIAISAVVVILLYFNSAVARISKPNLWINLHYSKFRWLGDKLFLQGGPKKLPLKDFVFFSVIV